MEPGAKAFFFQGHPYVTQADSPSMDGADPERAAGHDCRGLKNYQYGGPMFLIWPE